jgi:hypothetical protein
MQNKTSRILLMRMKLKTNHSRLACRVCSTNMYERGSTVWLVKELTAGRAVPGYHVAEDTREGSGFSSFRVGVPWQDGANIT